MEGITASFKGLDKYVVTKVGYQQTVVSMTEHEANVLYNFLEWACIDDEYTVERIEQYDAVEWGGLDDQDTGKQFMSRYRPDCQKS